MVREGQEARSHLSTDREVGVTLKENIRKNTSRQCQHKGFTSGLQEEETSASRPVSRFELVNNHAHKKKGEQYPKYRRYIESSDRYAQDPKKRRETDGKAEQSKKKEREIIIFTKRAF